FQAEDGIRDFHVTGVQTCALPIYLIPLKRRAFTREEARRAQPHILEAGARSVRVASAEDAVLTKLEWFEMGGRSSARQWNDILEIGRASCRGRVESERVHVTV